VDQDGEGQEMLIEAARSRRCGWWQSKGIGEFSGGERTNVVGSFVRIEQARTSESEGGRRAGRVSATGAAAAGFYVRVSRWTGTMGRSRGSNRYFHSSVADNRN
jgi:hypothetical protein